MSLFVTIEPSKLHAWGAACRAQLIAENSNAPEAWAEAARAWDALAKFYSAAEGDRDIYTGLARDAWLRSVGRELSS